MFKRGVMRGSHSRLRFGTTTTVVYKKRGSYNYIPYIILPSTRYYGEFKREAFVPKNSSQEYLDHLTKPIDTSDVYGLYTSYYDILEDGYPLPPAHYLLLLKRIVNYGYDYTLVSTFLKRAMQRATEQILFYKLYERAVFTYSYIGHLEGVKSLCKEMQHLKLSVPYINSHLLKVESINQDFDSCVAMIDQIQNTEGLNYPIAKQIASLIVSIPTDYTSLLPDSASTKTWKIQTLNYLFSCYLSLSQSNKIPSDDKKYSVASKYIYKLLELKYIRKAMEVFRTISHHQRYDEFNGSELSFIVVKLCNLRKWNQAMEVYTCMKNVYKEMHNRAAVHLISQIREKEFWRFEEVKQVLNDLKDFPKHQVYLVIEQVNRRGSKQEVVWLWNWIMDEDRVAMVQLTKHLVKILVQLEERGRSSDNTNPNPNPNPIPNPNPNPNPNSNPNPNHKIINMNIRDERIGVDEFYRRLNTLELEDRVRRGRY